MSNTFDWRVEDYSTPNYKTSIVKSPFHENTNPLWMRFLWDDSDYYAPDYHPEDGWEMIKYDLDKNDFLYLVLYNKFSSILRVLVAFNSNKDDYESLVATLSYSPQGSITGLFSPQRGRGQYMDEKSVSLASSTVQFNNSASLFHVIDFPVEYDPCTCFFDDGTINISFDLAKEQRLTAYGRLIGIDNTLANIQNGIGTPLLDNFLTSVYSEKSSSITYEHTAGTMIFKDWSNLNQYYLKNKIAKQQLENQLKEYEDVQKALKLILSAGAAFSLGAADPNISKLIKATKKISGIMDLFSAPIKKRIKDAQGEIDAAGGIVLTQAEVAITGSLETEIPIGRSITFSTPGRLNNDVRCNAAYPLYDDVLGRFAILEQPSIDIGGKIEVGNNYPRPRDSEQKVKFRFNENTSLLYKFNPAAGVVKEGSKIYAGIIFKTKNNTNIQTEILSNLTLVSSENGSATYASPMMPLECLSSLTMERTTYGDRPQTYALQLKILILYEFEQEDRDGEANKAIQILTYPLATNSKDYYTIPTTPNYEEELTLTTQNFTSNQTIFALDKITIDGILTTNSNVEITIIAGEIELLDGASIGPGITLINGESPVICDINNSIREVSRNELETFCKSSSYKSNQPENTRRSFIENNDDHLENSQHLVNSLSANPNPVKDFVEVRFNLEEDLNNVSLSIRDVTGQTVAKILDGEALSKGKFAKQINVSNLSSGVYFISLSSDSFNETLKIVKF